MRINVLERDRFLRHCRTQAPMILDGRPVVVDKSYWCSQAKTLVFIVRFLPVGTTVDEV